MSSLADNSAHMILTDPPYFLHKMDDRWDNRRLRDRSASPASGSVVGGLPPGMRYDPAQGAGLQEFLAPVAAEWLRVVRPGGFALVFASPRLVHRAAVAMDDAGWEIRDMIAWHHGEGQFKAFTVDHFVRKRNEWPDSEKQEIIDSLGGRKTPMLRPVMEMIVLGQAPRDGTFVDNWMKYETGLMNIKSPVLDTESAPKNVIRCPKERRRFGHVTPKPVDLLRHLIRLFCVKGGTVLDSFAGTGSSGVAALLEGCSFIGFEVDPDMAFTAGIRIQECVDAGTG